jgi:hypothetical protein
MAKHKRRLLAFLFLITILFGGVFIAKNTPLLSEGDPATLKPDPEEDPEEMKAFLQNIFCMTTEQDIGGTECWTGYYDEARDIAYFAGSFGCAVFYDNVNTDDVCDTTSPNYRWYYRDFMLKNGTKTFDMLTLSRPEYLGKIIVFRVHSPDIKNEPWCTAYENRKGQDGYYFLYVKDRSRSIYWAASERHMQRSVLLIMPHTEELKKKPFEEHINNYVERLGLDKSSIVYIDIK